MSKSSDYVVVDDAVEQTSRDKPTTGKLIVASFLFFPRNSDVLSRVMILEVVLNSKVRLEYVRFILAPSGFSSRFEQLALSLVKY